MLQRKRGMILPMVLVVVVIAGMLYSGVLVYSLQETHGLDQSFRRKMAFRAAESGVDAVATRLISTPFFDRWYIHEAADLPTLEQRLRAFNSTHLEPPDGQGTPYGESGRVQTYIVENAKPQEHVLNPPTDSEGLLVDGASVVNDMYMQAKLSHVDIYSVGSWEDPVTGRESHVLYYGTFVIFPEPFLYEYDTNGDGVISYMGAGTGEEGAAEIDFFANETGNDLINHPFADPELWMHYIPQDPEFNMQFSSPEPIFARVIRRTAFHDTVEAEIDGQIVSRPITELDLTDLNDRNHVRRALANINVAYLENHERARQVIANLDETTVPQDMARSRTVTTQQMEDLVSSAGGLAAPPDFSDNSPAFRRARNEWLMENAKNYTVSELHEPYANTQFMLAIDRIGDNPTARYLGRLFRLDQANLDNTVIDRIHSGEVRTAEQFFDLVNPSVDRDPGRFIDDSANVIQHYAVVKYPRGRLQEHITEHDPDSEHVDAFGMADSGEGYISYSLDRFFEGQINNVQPDNVDWLYSEMEAEMVRIADAEQNFGELSGRGADIDTARNHIPIVLVDHDNLEFTTPFENVLKYYDAHVGFNWDGSPDDNYDFDFEMPQISPQLTNEWKYICHSESEKERNDPNQPSRYIKSQLAVSP